VFDLEALVREELGTLEHQHVHCPALRALATLVNLAPEVFKLVPVPRARERLFRVQGLGGGVHTYDCWLLFSQKGAKY